MECPNCNKKIKEDYKVCPYCETKLNNNDKISNKVKQKKNNNSIIINGDNEGDIYQAQGGIYKVEYDEHYNEQIAYRSKSHLKNTLSISTIVGVISSVITIYEYITKNTNFNTVLIVSLVIAVFSIYHIIKTGALLIEGKFETIFGHTVYKGKEDVYYTSKKWIQGKCPICDGDIYLRDFTYDWKPKKYGVCEKHPLDHIFSFEKDTMTGIRIEENEKAKLKK
ncbi:zinc ribbon domain-containing protein [Clostridium sp. YIM B02555]|uniref:zinc ribbon domain-containing protein n=1 Tax=Clostridium sp. YIM B02555 TaxID=2911968 RepID=UPI001EEDA731|nr:zinc ribbon domain-containing protein [Clostridium sp. YIM B02555]